MNLRLVSFHAASEYLHKIFLAYFVKPQAFRVHATDLTELDYLNSPFLLPDEELLLEDACYCI